MKTILLLVGLVFLTACAAEPGSEKWCDAKKEQPKSEWTGTDASTYAKKCILESTTIGSEKWCENLIGRFVSPIKRSPIIGDCRDPWNLGK